MRLPVWIGLSLVLLTAIIGCGSNPVDAIIADENAWEKERSGGDVNQQLLFQKKEEINKKIAQLTPAQKKELDERRPKEVKSSLPAGSGGGRPKG